MVWCFVVLKTSAWNATQHFGSLIVQSVLSFLPGSRYSMSTRMYLSRTRFAVIRTGMRQAFLPTMYCCSLYHIVEFKFPVFSTKGGSLVTIQWMKKITVKKKEEIRLKTCENLIRKNSTILKTQNMTKKYGTVDLAENILECCIRKGNKKVTLECHCTADRTWTTWSRFRQSISRRPYGIRNRVTWLGRYERTDCIDSSIVII